MLTKIRRGNKKSSAPRCLPPESGCGCINTPHGTELYDIIGNASDIKNARCKVIGEPSRLIQMVDIANVGIYFGIAKEYARKYK